jgi:serine/threonine protein kinase
LTSAHVASNIPTMLGTVVGGYRIVAKLNEGGMGAVYRAEHALIGKPAAVKVLLPELSMNRDVVGRFFNEARATTQIRHPGIVEVFDFGYLPDGQAYLVMEFLDGEPLSRRIHRLGQLDEASATGILRAVCAALTAAHAHGIVHRDLKPDNIFLVRDPEIGERPKLLDFGIAKLTDTANAPTSKTRTGTVMGTPMYMSPEQCRGAGDVDHRSDLYSLGCILHELVCGRPPFVAEGAGEIIGAHQFVAPLPPSRYRPGLSPQIESVILRLLAKRPDDRIQSAQELIWALGGTPTSPPAMVAPRAPTAPPAPTRTTTLSSGAAQTVRTPTSASRRAGWAAIGGAALAVAVIAAIGLGGSDRPPDAGPAPAASPVEAAALPAAPPPPAPVVVDAGVAVAPETPAAAPEGPATTTVDAGTPTTKAPARRRPSLPRPRPTETPSPDPIEHDL